MGLFFLRLLVPWRLMILLCLSVTLLDPRTFKDVPRSPRRRFGSCSERDNLSLTRVCIVSFVQRPEENPKTSCRQAYIDRLKKCAKDVALHCHKNESKYDRRKVEQSFASRGYRAYQEQDYCNGINIEIPLPPYLKLNQCSKTFVTEKERCEDNYVKTYRENKTDKNLYRKYAEAKACVKNATLTLCRMTEVHVEVVNFFYDSFNPLCFNLIDPSMVKRSGGGESTGLASYSFVVVLSVVVLIRTLS